MLHNRCNKDGHGQLLGIHIPVHHQPSQSECAYQAGHSQCVTIIIIGVFLCMQEGMNKIHTIWTYVCMYVATFTWLHIGIWLAGYIHSLTISYILDCAATYCSYYISCLMMIYTFSTVYFYKESTIHI